MESSCLTFTTVSAPSRPASSLTHNISNFKLLQANHLFFPSSLTAENSSSRSSIRRRGRRGFGIKASKKANFSANQTLASNWDVSDFSNAPSWLPRFEELDTTNTLLRQRIVFLGFQVEKLRSAGLINGGSLENAIVCSVTRGWLNPPLRFQDEPCRHKVLDLIGDISLFAKAGSQGVPVAHTISYKGGHALHASFGRYLKENQQSSKQESP